jgi:4-hydroxy-3-polyprenylbenzoate decarboxylase
MPAFYGNPQTLEQALDTVVGRLLDHLGIEHDLVKRWGERAPPDPTAENR